MCLKATGREDMPNTMEGKYLHWNGKEKDYKGCILWPAGSKPPPVPAEDKRKVKATENGVYAPKIGFFGWGK